MNLMPLMPRRLPRLFQSHPPSPGRRRPAPTGDAAGSADDDSAGCGWFDSSHALSAGLMVLEDPPGGAADRLEPSWSDTLIAFAGPLVHWEHAR